MAEITIHAWGKVATVTYPDELESTGPAAFVELADPDEIHAGMSAEEYAIGQVVRFVSETMKAAAAKGIRDTNAAAMLALDEQTSQITVEVE